MVLSLLTDEENRKNVYTLAGIIKIIHYRMVLKKNATFCIEFHYGSFLTFYK